MPKRLFHLLLASGMLLSATLYPAQLAAQVMTRTWNKTFGGSERDYVRVMKATRDGGSIVGGMSTSGVSGNKTQPSRGNLDFWVVKLDGAGNKVWDKTFGGFGHDQMYALQQTPDGGYLLAGTSMSGINGDKTQPNRGEEDYWVVKIDANGTKEWDKTFGGNYADNLTAMEPTSDGGYLLGGVSGSDKSGDKSEGRSGLRDIWLVKIDAAGNKVWDKCLGGREEDLGSAMCATRDGGVVVLGNSNSGSDTRKSEACNGGFDYWVIKLDAAGNREWDRTLGGAEDETAGAVQQAADGSYFVTGFSVSGVSGNKTQASKGREDYWVVKLDSKGNTLWDRVLGGDERDKCSSVLATEDGGVIVAGTSYSGISGDKTQSKRGGYDFWLVKLDGAGTTRWDLTLGGPTDDQLFASSGLALTPDGGLLVAGDSSPGSGWEKTQTGFGDDDFWVLKLGGATVTGTTGARPALGKENELVYPNPVQTHLTLRLPTAALRTEEWQVALLDATGRAVYTTQYVAPVGAATLALDIGQHRAGLYVLRVQGSNGYVATQRVMME